MVKVYKVTLEGKTYEVEVELLAEKNGKPSSAPVKASAPQSVATPVKVQSSDVPTGTGEVVTSPMQGSIIKVLKNTGDFVSAGEAVIILEAMKMENSIVAPKEGKLSAVLVSEGQSVENGSSLFEIG